MTQIVTLDRLNYWHETCKERLGPGHELEEMINSLIEDINTQQYHVVVLGEFKNGKTTLVNSLLETELLPTDVLPSTAFIHCIMNGEKPRGKVVYPGNNKSENLTEDDLSNYALNGPLNEEESELIRYIAFQLPSQFLESSITLIDTPGVNDLSEHRTEIAKSFVPRSDVILFVLNMTNPLTKTEKEFLENYVLVNDYAKIIFVANFIDLIEDDQIDETMAILEQRIRQSLHIENPVVIGVSSIEAMEAVKEKDEEGLEISGINELKRMISTSLETQAKLDHEARYIIRYKNLLTQLQTIMKTRISSLGESEDLLQKRIDQIKAIMDKEEFIEEGLDHFLEAKKRETHSIIGKSIQYFGTNLLEDVHSLIDQYQGDKYNQFVETQLKSYIKKQLKNWLENYQPYITELLKKIERKIEKELNELFQGAVELAPSSFTYAENNTPDMDLSVNDQNSQVISGLTVGGVSVIALAVGAPFFIPVITMAGLPLITDRIRNKKAEMLKPIIKSEIDKIMPSILSSFHHEVIQSVNHFLEELKNTSKKELTQQLQVVLNIYEENLLKMREDEQKIHKSKDNLLEIVEMVDKELLEIKEEF